VQEFIRVQSSFLSSFATVLSCPTLNLYGTPVICDISYFTFSNLIAYHTQSDLQLLGLHGCNLPQVMDRAPYPWLKLASFLDFRGFLFYLFSFAISIKHLIQTL
jgi:hypothetical protein